MSDRCGHPQSCFTDLQAKLLTGQCFDDETVSVPTFKLRVVEDRVQVAIAQVK